MVKKKVRRRKKRYTAAEKKKILDTARKEGLTGQQVAKRFGIAQLTFYRWRGPVYSRPTRKASKTKLDDSLIRKEIRSRFEEILPQIIREEVDAYLTSILSQGRQSRRR